MTEDLWVTRTIADLYRGSACEQVVCRFGWKIYEWHDQSHILVEDLRVNRLTADLSVRSMSEQISYGFLLKIYMRAELIGILIDQKAVA